jgi:hypothetical protein
VRSVIDSVRQAEERIDGLVKDLHDIETEMSLLIHRSETASSKSRGVQFISSASESGKRLCDALK